MKKNITLNLIVLILVALLCLYIGTLFHSAPEVDTTRFKYKYDSAIKVTHNQLAILKENSNERDSARGVVARMKQIESDLKKQITLRDQRFEQQRKDYRDRLMKMTETQLAKEARDIYNRAYPAPLFDTTVVGEPVSVEKHPLIHLLSQNSKAIHLAKINADLGIQVDVQTKHISTLDFQVSKYQSDSAAYQGIVSAKDVIIDTQKEEAKLKEKAYKKELRRQKRQKAVATGLAILATLAAIIL